MAGSRGTPKSGSWRARGVTDPDEAPHHRREFVRAERRHQSRSLMDSSGSRPGHIYPTPSIGGTTRLRYQTLTMRAGIQAHPIWPLVNG